VSHAQLLLAADILGPLVEEVVFLGGATIHVWVTEPTAPPTRATDDVDGADRPQVEPGGARDRRTACDLRCHRPAAVSFDWWLSSST
jgi:hypothetical protein